MLHFINRVGRTCGGIKPSTEVVINFSKIEDSYECFFVKTVAPSLGNVLVAGIYRPPSKPLVDFTEFITDAFEYTNNYGTVFTGDFNVNVKNHSYLTLNYSDVFHQFRFVK